MAQALAPRFLVDAPTHLQPAYSAGVVSLQTGAALAAGTRLRVSGTTSVSIPSVASGSRTYSVVIRVDWSKGAADAATLVAVPSTVVNSTSTPNSGQINRIPGVLYDALVAQVTRYAGSTTGYLVDYRTWGGDGGPLRVTDGALTAPGPLDARVGTIISTDRGLFTKRLDNDGVWRSVGTASNPWKLWTPTLRYYGEVGPNGTSGGNPVFLGTNGSYSGRYRVVDGMLDGFIQITTGAGADFGSGSITMDLPLPCANWQADTWSTGHIFTDTTHGGDGNFDWVSQALVKAGWTRALLFAPVSGDFGDLKVHRAVAPGGGNGTGYPVILGGKSIGTVYTYNVTYPVD
jgi:hypothetical protein